MTERIRPLDNPLINRRIKTLGIFSVPITISNPATGLAVTVDALVDTGASLTILPASQLVAIGLRPARYRRFELGDGRIVELGIASADVTVQGETAGTEVAFGDEGVSATLGVIVLESAGLTVDPRGQRLLPTDLLLH